MPYIRIDTFEVCTNLLKFTDVVPPLLFLDGLHAFPTLNGQLRMSHYCFGI
jgi:hypothetical protein